MYQLRGSIPIILQVGNNFADHGKPTRACMIAAARGTNGTAAIYDGVGGESTIEKSVSSHQTNRSEGIGTVLILMLYRDLDAFD